MLREEQKENVVKEANLRMGMCDDFAIKEYANKKNPK